MSHDVAILLLKIILLLNQTTVPNPPTSLKLLRFYLMLKVCPKTFAVVARYTSERLEDLRETELRSTIETFDSPVPRPPPFQSMPTTPDTSHFGTK